jgi:ABC-type Fe3+-siderophore transport system permease subunit
MFAKSDIEKYFGAEKSEAVIFMVAGVCAVLVAVVLMIWFRNAFNKGLVFPLVVVAVMHIAVGASVYSRADRQRISNIYAYDMDPASLRDEEVPRMQKVIRNFVVLRWIEIALAVTAIALILLYRSSPERVILYGAGVGLFVQAALSLILDFFAEKRAHEYLNGIREFLRV